MADKIQKNTAPTNAANNQRKANQSPKEFEELNNGLYHGHLNEPVTRYNKAVSEKVVQKNNSLIIMGRDRMGGKSHGKGALKNSGQCASIDLVVGMSGVQNKEVIEVAPLGSIKKKKEPTTTEKDPSRDAARIFITQRSNVDHKDWFNLPDGTIPHSVMNNRSAIVLKADGIRIVSRDGGIKIIAGGKDIKNAQGVVTTWAQGINLIGGDGTTPCQPMVKGDNLVLCLLDMHHCIKDLFGMVNIIQKALVKFHANFALHNHTNSGAPSLSALLMSWEDEIQLFVKASMLAMNLGRHTKQYLTPTVGGERHYINSFRNHVN